MSCHPQWLPKPLTYGVFGGKWEEFLDSVYVIFEGDFKKCRPHYRGKPVVYNDAPDNNGKEKGFWHLVERETHSKRGDERVIDFRRCERISWAKAIIENCIDGTVSVWEEPAQGHRMRVLMWLEEMDYLVVLEERPKVFFLVTAYCTDMESMRIKLRKKRDEYLKQQKPP